MNKIISGRGRSPAIRCDNGPELTSRHFLAWAVEGRIELHQIQPGKPTQNAYKRKLSRPAATEILKVVGFQTHSTHPGKWLAGSTTIITDCARSGLGLQTPSEFTQTLGKSSLGKNEGFTPLGKRVWRFPLSDCFGYGFDLDGLRGRSVEALVGTVC